MEACSSQGRAGGIVSPTMAARGTLTPMGEWLALYDKLTSACILIRCTCSRSLLVRKVHLASASPVGDRMCVRWSLVGDLSRSCGMDPVPERPLGRGRKPRFLRPGGQSGSRVQAVWTKSWPTRMVVRSRHGFGLARMPVESGPTRDPGSWTRQRPPSGSAIC
jgi:hypothetical protein